MLSSSSWCGLCCVVLCGEAVSSTVCVCWGVLGGDTQQGWAGLAGKQLVVAKHAAKASHTQLGWRRTVLRHDAEGVAS